MTKPRKEYPAANVCIYCGDTNPPLGEEHIIPFGLNGNLVIPHASCRKCEKVTGWLERICLRDMFGPYRVRHGFKSGHPRDREKPFPLKLYDKEGKKQTIDLPLAEHPATIILPIFDPPNILSGTPPPNPDLPFRCGFILIGSTIDLKNATKLTEETSTDMVHIGSTNIAAFARMLAKIAHAYLYANTNGFEGGWKPMLRETIFGEFRSFHHFVGDAHNAQPVEDPSTIHRLQVVEAQVGDKAYCGVDIRLFANVDKTPHYRVIVAERSL